MFASLREYCNSLGLRTKLVVAITLPTIILVTLVLLATALYNIQQLKRSLVETTKSMVLALQQDFERIQLLDDQDTAVDLVDKIEPFENVERLYVFDLQGNIVFSYCREGVPVTAPPVAAEDPSRIAETVQSVDQALEVILPLNSGSRRFGHAYVQTHVSTRELEQEVGRLLLVTLVAIVSTVAVGFLVAFGLQRLISRPMLELGRAAALVSKHEDYTVRAVKYSNDELGTVVDTFNRMLVQIHESDSQLKRNRNQLEDRVLERTAELQQANHWLQQECAARVQTTQALRESEEATRAIVENASEGIITIDENGIVESFNAAASRSFGYRPEEVIGQNVSMLVPSPHAEQHDEYIRRYLHTGESNILSASREVEAKRKDGTVFPMDLSISEVHLGGRPRFTGIIRDLTERRIMQCELAQAQKLESVGHLAAGIAHEINTPTQYVGDNTRFLKTAFEDLSGVMDKLGKLLQAAKDGSVDEQLVAEVEQALQQADVEFLTAEIPQAIDQSLEGVERVAKIVRAMKEFSHPGGDEKRLVNLREAIETTITVARNEWKYVADMVTEFDPELPEVSCLPGELNQVFLNLIVNAAHAIAEKLGPDGSHKGTITVGTRRDGDHWVAVFVRDTGTGIPKKVLARIFDPFFTTKDVGQGTGQGLAIARSVVVDKHGGTIDCETEPGQGTTFIVRLPIHEEPSTPGARENENASSLC